MDKKSLVIGALGSALLFVTLGAATPVTVETTVPVEHEWQFHLEVSDEKAQAFSINKRTGEVRKYETWATSQDGIGVAGRTAREKQFGQYKTTYK